MLHQLLIWSYAGVGVVSLLGYWPTIRDLYFHKKPSANTQSYFFWTLSTGISFCYALFALHDFLLRIVTGISFFCCAIILGLSLAMRRAMKS